MVKIAGKNNTGFPDRLTIELDGFSDVVKISTNTYVNKWLVFAEGQDYTTEIHSISQEVGRPINVMEVVRIEDLFKKGKPAIGVRVDT